MRLIIRRHTVLAIALALATASAWHLRAAPAAAVVAAVDDPDYEAVEDTPLQVVAPGVLGNDTVGFAPCAVVLDDSNLDGTVELESDGSFVYTPDANFNGETSFTYGMQAEGSTPCTGEDGSATVTITVAPVNDAPTATADSFTALKNTTLNVGGKGVLINDHDIDGDTIQAILDVDVTHGTLVLALNGRFAYTPATGYTGPDGFSYRASDGALQSQSRFVSLTVKAVPPVPTPTPVPTPVPTPTPSPSVEPTPSPSVEPSPSPSVEPSASPSAALAPSPSPSATPAASPTPVPASDGGGVSLPVLLVIVLFVLLVGFGAALYLPKWLEAQRGGPRDID